MTQLILSIAIADPRFADPGFAAAILRRAEAIGVDLLVIGGPTALPFDPLVLAAWAAVHTTRMGIIATVPAQLSHPFHVARALSGIDMLSGGRSGWSPVPGGAPAGMAEDMVAAACSLWDAWGAETLIIDKASGRYLDTSKVRASDYEGPFFKVRGPVNAMRPPQGHPVLVCDAAAGLSLRNADIALVSDDRHRPPATRYVLKCTVGVDREQVFARADIAGVHFELDDPVSDLATIADAFAASPDRSTTGTLRERLDLSLQPARQPQEHVA